MPYIPITPSDEQKMLEAIGVASVDDLFRDVPGPVRLKAGLQLPAGLSESRLKRHFRLLARNNQPVTDRPCFLGAGVYSHEIPACVKAVVTRPEFVTAYTPYQPEISQGTLKSLFDYQTYLCELTGLEVSNSSLYDGASAVAEAVCMGLRVRRGPGPVLVSRGVNPETRAVVRTYLDPRDIPVVELPLKGTETDLAALVSAVRPDSVVLVQQPNFLGSVEDLASIAAACKAKGAFLVVAAGDAMNLALLPTPGSQGADACAGSGQSFGNPMSFGGPHVGFLTVRKADIRQMPGRVVGATTDRLGRTAYALTFQAREQHIRREKASSNVCTTQSLMAHFASCWLYRKGGAGAREAAHQAVATTHALVRELTAIPGFRIETSRYANEVVIRPPKPGYAGFLADWGIVAPCEIAADYPEFKDCVLAACTETTTLEDLEAFIAASAEFAGKPRPVPASQLPRELPPWITPGPEPRIPAHSEVETVRYYTGLARMNYGVDDGFYPLGSCTMKYNPKVNEEIALSPEWTELHPLQRPEEVQGALQVLYETEKWLCEITGCAAVTLQPAAGAHGELTALMIARKYFRDRGETGRVNVLCPESAHGTNPASASMAGFNVVSVPLDARGNTDLSALKQMVGKDTAVLMLTNPSTLGLFEEQIVELAALVHEAGALLYYDGANMNAILGTARPADMGFDLVHLNLHKSFSTPHGGGGPGSGPVGVVARLVDYLPQPRVEKEGNRYHLSTGSARSIGRVKSNTGQFGVVLRAYAYCLRLGREGLERVGRYATLNANYLRARLKEAYPAAYDRTCMHEFVLSMEPLKKRFGISALDLAKRLIDYGYHPPTIYFPLVVHEAVMIEPTETETRATLDAFVDAMLKIREEMERTPEVFRTAPHQTPVSRLDEVKAVKEPRLTACL